MTPSAPDKFLSDARRERRRRDDRLPRSRSSDTASRNRNSVHGVLYSNSPTVSPALSSHDRLIYIGLHSQVVHIVTILL